jgi:hypothetical protein
VKAGLRGLSAEAKRFKGESVYTALNGNAYFPDPQPSLTEYRAVLDALAQANTDAEDRGRQACARKRAAVAAFDQATARLAAYVNSVALGDVTKLVSSGFMLAKRPEPQNQLASPQVINFRRTPWQNRLEMHWSSVHGAIIYLVERCRHIEASEPVWERIALTTRPKLTVERGDGAGPFAYRVCAVGTQVQGPYTNAKLPAAA